VQFTVFISPFYVLYQTALRRLAGQLAQDVIGRLVMN
jgi:hypothetical protein